MSSTNRGYNRHKFDYYVTPPPAIEEFFNAWEKDLPGGELTSKDWLDPCAGGDKDHPMSYPDVIGRRYDTPPMTIDIREDSPADLITDYLNYDVQISYDIIITNPPFYLAREIIEKALQDVADGGYVVMLLRLNFFGSKARFSFFQEHLPQYAYVHHKRMSFTDDGKTDSIEYMHAVWQKGAKVTHTKLKVI